MKNIIIFLVFIASHYIHSQSIVGGYIYVEDVQGNPLAKRIALIVSADTMSSFSPTYLLLDYGDGSSTDTAFFYISMQCNNMRSYSLVSNHTYPANGSYTINCIAGYFITGINNLPSSVNKTLSLTEKIVVNCQQINFTPYFLSCASETLTLPNNQYFPNINDIESDSLTYSIIDPGNIPGFVLPQFNVNYSGLITYTGSVAGSFLIPVQVEEWRKINNTWSNLSTVIFYFYITVVQSSGFNEAKENLSLVKFSPNPINDRILLQLPPEYNFSNALIEIYDNIGKKVYVSGITGSDTVFDLSFLTQGLYHFKIKNEDFFKVFKVVKQ